MKLFCSKCSKGFPVEGDSAEVTCPDCGQVIARPDSDLGPGVVLGDFVIEKSISVGGMGEVFQARQISLDRPVALKVLLSKYTNDRDYVASLFREARAAARISHPNIVQAYAVGQDSGFFYFAMELVRGETLKNILRKEGVLAPAKAAKIIHDVANALDVAWHEQKLVHQDIKPDNIMLDVNGFSKLADLGLAKTGSLDTASDDDSDEVLGTPQYISPEQLTGVPTDARSDIYSLGATFYHIVTGQLPYRSADMDELVRMHDAGNLTPPKEIRPDLPEELNRIIIKMMARNIENRYQTPVELCADLEKFIVADNAAFIDDIKLRSIVQPEVPLEKPVILPPRTPSVAAPKAGPIAVAKANPAAAPQVPAAPAPRPAVPRAPGVPPRPAVPRAPGVPPRPAVPGAPGVPPRPAVPGAPGVPPRPAVLGAPGVPPRPAVPGAPGVPSASGMPAGMPPGVSYSSEKKESFWDKNKKSLILLILLAIVGAVIGFFYLSDDQDSAAGSSASAETADAPADVPEESADPEAAASTDAETDPASEAAAEAPAVQQQSEEAAAAEKRERIARYTQDYTDFRQRRSAGGESAPENIPQFIAPGSTYQQYEKPDLSRPEYISLAESIINWRKANLDKGLEFLGKVDEAWSVLRNPQTPREYELLTELMNEFSALDEFHRCESARAAAREAHLASIAAVHRQQEEQARQAREAQERRRREQEEQARQAQENARIRAEAERQRQERENSVQNQVNQYLARCITALHRSAISGDKAPLNAEIQQATIFIDTIQTFSDAERKIISDFRALLGRMPEECDNLINCFNRFRRINESRGVRLIVGGITLPLVRITPGEIVCRERSGAEKVMAYKELEERTRITLMRSFDRLRIRDYEFYSDLFHSKRPADSTVPDGFWKQVWPIAKDAILQ